MKRIAEKEVMDDEANAAAYAAADFSEPHEHFISLFCGQFSQAQPARVLDLGCGSADISIRFARRFPGCRVTGMDASQAMLKHARQAIQRAGLTHAIQLQQRYLSMEALDEEEKYDSIISNSLLHHLTDPMVLWHSIQQLAATGARIFIMDLSRPKSDDQARQLVSRYAGNESELLQEDFYHSLRAAYTPNECLAQIQAIGLDLAVQTVSDRHFIVQGTL